jgi:D-alanyl-D-alanine carboxypeptidase
VFRASAILNSRYLRLVFIGATTLALAFSSTVPASALVIPAAFKAHAKAKALHSPGVLVIDPTSSKVIYQVAPDTLRAPASVLKLISMTTALNAFSADKRFATKLYQSQTPGHFVLVGESDPWITGSPFEASAYHRAFLPALINKALAADHSLTTIDLDFRNLYSPDVAMLVHYFSGRVKIVSHQLPNDSAATSEEGSLIGQVDSPPLSEIIKFTLLWSDNLLADRLAHMSAKQLGFGSDEAGLNAAFKSVLGGYQIDTTGLAVQDGNGLSHETRVSTRMIAELLLAIHREPKLAPIYAGLPVSGRTGTLKVRFVSDAPSAVGLIHAKTGWINNTVSLAGFVTVGASQYIFTVIADKLPNSEVARQAARVDIDQMLATIARRPTRTSVKL